MAHKILVVDDEPYILALLGRVVAKLGHEALEAKDGEEAMALARREKPVLALLDIHIPRRDGRTVISDLLRLDPNMVVIIVTGDRDLEMAKELMKAGARDYLLKPIDVGYLEMSITAHLALL